MRKNHPIGGFTAINTGKIENCYSLVKLSGGNAESGGFVGNNTGSIAHSFCLMDTLKTRGGFSGHNLGAISGGYFFHSLSDRNKKLRALSDVMLGQRMDEIKSEQDMANLGFDLQNIWEYSRDAKPVRFLSDKWFYELELSPGHEKLVGTKPLLIHNADELRAFAEKVNDGDAEAMGAYAALDADIDLGGKEWTPIGKERPRAFAGLFDGRGHIVENFVLKDDKVTNKGFFGFLKGEVYNLTVDCSIRSRGLSGGLAACNEGGIIGCCAAIVDISGKDAEFGGLVGSNGGQIFQSYSAGRIHTAALPLWLWLIPNGLLLLALLLLLFWPKSPEQRAQVFAPVPYDPDAVIDPEQTEIKPKTDGNFVSFQFEQEIDVSLASGLCTFDFKNPGDSNHNIVVQLQFTDNQAKTIMGSTGRTAEEQQALEALPGYDPDSYRTVIAESGAIPPGYMLDNLRLVQQPNGATIPAGSYNATVYLIFYDIETNNRAMLESQLPVVISVHR